MGANQSSSSSGYYMRTNSYLIPNILLICVGIPFFLGFAFGIVYFIIRITRSHSEKKQKRERRALKANRELLKAARKAASHYRENNFEDDSVDVIMNIPGTLYSSPIPLGGVQVLPQRGVQPFAGVQEGTGQYSGFATSAASYPVNWGYQ